MTEPEIDPLAQLANELKDAIEKQDWDRAVKAGTQFVGWCVTAKIEREDRKHNEITAELAGIRDALDLIALAAFENAGKDLSLGVRELGAKILGRLDCKRSEATNDPCIGEPVE